MQLPHDDELVLVSGCHPIRAKKARYYEDRQLQARILPPPTPTGGTTVDGNAGKSIPAAKDDWQGAVVAPPLTNTEDPANVGIRREPEVPEHEDIITPPRKPAQEFDLPDDEADDDAQRLRVLQRQVRATARQVSLDPADDMGL
jgi:type IV secretion system protein VirD4